MVVAILDTAPCMHDLVAAYERWQKVDPKNRHPQSPYRGNPPNPHGIIESLLKPKPDNLLTVHYASYEELLRMRSVHLKDHNYDMTDHGLFVAGIIHSIAPAAEIHLYEVLNPEGVGDLKSIALGLSKVLNSFPGQPLVVNCSLVLNIPLLGHSITDLDTKIKGKIVHEWSKHERNVEQDEKDEKKVKLTDEFWSPKSLDWPARQDWLARQSRAIERICDLIYARNSRVIAAAGNDHEPGGPEAERPQARYPAAFESVVGVGALKKGSPLGHAEYSDQSDRPAETGITTLGGEKGVDNGVLGIYIGKFPDEKDDNKPGPENKCDWAWWAGTSFAAPIISGATAAVLSKEILSGNPPLTTEQAIQALYDAQVITIGPRNEDVLHVTQIGYKVGCTSLAVQEQLGMREPIFGRLFDTGCHPS
ncbi:MAG: S8 family serine peptidase, partial [Anaerolineae bacterium]|nr:S8 family serine peptidase [Anaerolineae bacterium]